MSKNTRGKAAPAAASATTGATAAPPIQTSGSGVPPADGQPSTGSSADPSGQPGVGADSAGSGTPPNIDPDQELPEGSAIWITLRHKTEYPTYRRAGLVLTKQPKAYRVTPDQLEIIQGDQWIEVVADQVAATDEAKAE